MNDDYCYDIVFLALARDCAESIPGLLRGLDNLRQSGLNVHALLGENGSHDNTRELLEEAASSTDLVSVIDTSFMSVTSERLQRMALGRQFLADQAKVSLMPARAVCVVDVDEPFLEHVDPAAIFPLLDRVSADGSVFAVAATSRPTYYDLLAFEDDDRSFVDLDKELQRLQSNPWAYYTYFRKVIYPEQRRLTSDFDMDCRSAFNGLCFYRADIYAKGTYLSPDDGPWICEHITFNRSLVAATGRHMVIDGSLVLPMPKEHGHRQLLGFAWQRTRKLPQLVKRIVTSRLGLNR